MRPVLKPALAAIAIALLAASPKGAIAAKKEPAAAAGGVKPSKAFQDKGAPAQAAIDAIAAAPDKAAAVANATALFEAAVPAATTEDDKYMLGTLALKLAAATNDRAMQARALDYMLASASTPANLRGQLASQRGDAALVLKDDAGAVRYFTAAYEAGVRDDVEATLAEANHRLGNHAEAMRWLKLGIDAREAAGTAIPEQWYLRMASFAQLAKDSAAVTQWTRTVATKYPTAKNWRTALRIYLDNGALEPGDKIDVLRLMRRANALTSEQDFALYVEAADPRRLPGEVVAVVTEAQGKGVRSTYLSQQLTVAQAAVAADKASLPGIEREAKTSSNGKVVLGTADALLGYDEYARAAALYSLAAAKGGADADRANLRLGIALLGSGDRAGATAAFAKVGAPSRKAIADYWLAYAASGGAAPAA